jgi:ribonuclease VapC
VIVVDSSALVAIVRGEPERHHMIGRIRQAGRSQISAVNYMESAMVCEGGRRAAGRAFFERDFAILELLGLSVAPADRALSDLAHEAFRQYGKGRHAAALNLGDCFSYALAKAADAPLLFKGDDFAKTDVARA